MGDAVKQKMFAFTQSLKGVGVVINPWRFQRRGVQTCAYSTLGPACIVLGADTMSAVSGIAEILAAK
jgi:hypothetical protein